MSYNNHVTPKEVGREHSMVAERKRAARLRENGNHEALIIHREAAMPPMSESRRRQPVTHTAWVPTWMQQEKTAPVERASSIRPFSK